MYRGMKKLKILDKLPFRKWRNKAPLVAIIPLHGVIAPGSSKFRGEQLNLASFEEMIEEAFEAKGVKAVALAINSPGGSPVQSSLLAGRIRQLADEKEIPVYAFAEDVMASGGYWLGLCADEIYADRNSIVGSIGVVSAGFGFPALLEKLGVERRVYAAGDSKVKLDPFKPEKDSDIEWLTKVQGEIHENFKALVKERRGERLKKRKDKELFSGDVWTGARAVELGLIDGLADLRSFMRDKFGDKVKFKTFEGRKGWLQKRLGLGAKSASVDAIEGLVRAAEHKAVWNRFGL